jgi:hypothetical protein
MSRANKPRTRTCRSTQQYSRPRSWCTSTALSWQQLCLLRSWCTPWQSWRRTSPGGMRWQMFGWWWHKKNLGQSIASTMPTGNDLDTTQEPKRACMKRNQRPSRQQRPSQEKRKETEEAQVNHTLLLWQFMATRKAACGKTPNDRHTEDDG